MPFSSAPVSFAAAPFGLTRTVPTPGRRWYAIPSSALCADYACPFGRHVQSVPSSEILESESDENRADVCRVPGAMIDRSSHKPIGVRASAHQNRSTAHGRRNHSPAA